MDRPILFSAPMIKALLEGRKTQTRRTNKCFEFKHEPGGPRHAKFYMRRADMCWNSFETMAELVAKHCPHGKPADRLWVKETHALLYQTSDCPVIAYRADDSARIVFTPPEGKFTLAGQAGEAASTWRAEHIRWRPSIHMHRWASRLTLEITDVRVQRVEDISEDDAKAEGFLCRGQFLELFYNVNKRAPAWSNPWVWVLTFKVTSHA